MVTDDELERARQDGAFRRELITAYLDHLLAGLAKLRASEHHTEPVPAQQIREGVQLAVRLADILQKAGGRPSAA
jgi:hypothetical protein